MTKIINFVKKLLPSYAIGPLAAVIFVNFVVFSGTQLLMDDVNRYSVLTEIDRLVPFVPAFIYIYFLAFAQWFLSWILIAREGKPFLYRFAAADILSKLICLIFFVFYPTVMDRPVFEVTGAATFLVNLAYQVDKPYNLFPSIHVLESCMACAAAFSFSRPPKYSRTLNILFSLLVCLSVMFVKQHAFLDIPGGIAAALLGLLGARLLKNPIDRLARRNTL
ncbi:MAG: phosphatase PAP2 family protein [Firmicutes bacterium]|nr:phosphatase PAP2 family protein [Bacillota bacterium]